MFLTNKQKSTKQIVYFIVLYFIYYYILSFHGDSGFVRGCVERCWGILRGVFFRNSSGPVIQLPTVGPLKGSDYTARAYILEPGLWGAPKPDQLLGEPREAR